ncbi:putative T7SS-secreted protein [Streptomyces sp. NPDC020096]
MSGFLDGIDSFGDSLENLYDEGKKAVGGTVDGMAHVVGDGLDMVGLHSAAHAVHGAGDWFADGMGADVPEMQLDEAKAPSDLIHGDPKAIREAASHLEKFSAGFEETGQGLQRLDAQHWKGTAADKFREKFAPHPKQWLIAADSCRLASEALVGYAHVVQWAQGQARQALDLYAAAKKKSDGARAAYNGQVDQYNAYLRLGSVPGASGQGPQKPGPFHDPGEAGMAAAQEMVNEARRQRDAEGDEAAKRVAAAVQHAPAKPSFLHRMAGDYVDTMAAETIGIEHFGMGVLGAGADMLKFVRCVNPLDAYNITHPAMWLAHTNAVGAGLLHAGNHPVELVKSLVGSGWGTDPGDASGRFGLNVILGVATDGASATETAPADVAANLSKGLENAAEHGEFKPPTNVADVGQDWSQLAQPADGVSESAVHATSVDPETAQRFLDDRYPWMRDLNRPRFEAGVPGYNQNCAYTTAAVAKRIDGIHDFYPGPRMGPGHLDPEWLGNPNAQWSDVGTWDDVINGMKARGEGSQAGVWVGRPDGSGHFFNAINTDIGVVFLDGQSGRLGYLEKGVKIAYMPYR